jgi:hypothetical protein
MRGVPPELPVSVAEIEVRRLPRLRPAMQQPSPGADVGDQGGEPVPVHMWATRGVSQSRCRCGKGGPSLGADVAVASPAPLQMRRGVGPVAVPIGGGVSPGS